MTAIRVQPVNETRDPILRDSLSLNDPQKMLVAGGAIVGFLLLIYLMDTQHISQSLLLGIGLLLGYTLFHARFGFTSAFRRLMSVGNGQAMRSHMLMLAIAVTLFAPILAFGTTIFGGPVSGYVSPVGVSLLVGAFMFGIGMQLGGGCASGTLWAVGVPSCSSLLFSLSSEPLLALTICHSGQKKCLLLSLFRWRLLQVLVTAALGWYLWHFLV